MSKLFRSLAEHRKAKGLTTAQVEQQLVMGAGWVSRFESGEVEPSIGTIAAMLSLYGVRVPDFFSTLDLGSTLVALDRHLSAAQAGKDLSVYFPMGKHAATVQVPKATVTEFNTVLKEMRDELATGKSREAVTKAFLAAVKLWPDANPSDLWYFVISHAYQDPYNHPAKDAGKDWAQSWKRTSGWALEAILVEHYNAQLQKHGIRLIMPPPGVRAEYMKSMGVPNPEEAQKKADVIAVGTKSNGKSEGFGVIHVKASFAERRTDDAPLSQLLIGKGYASPFVTMDCKAGPAAQPVNAGELGPTQNSGHDVSPKRLEIERDRQFDACFSFNTNTKPTPSGQASSARIHVLNFNNPNDPFAKHLIKKWKERQGID